VHETGTGLFSHQGFFNTYRGWRSFDPAVQSLTVRLSINNQNSSINNS
jgi:hypothetical protein